MYLKDNFYTISSHSETDGITAFKVALNPGHRIYGAHFPGYPVTPGVCIVEMAVELASVIAGRKLVCTGAKDIKFLVPVIPTETKELCFDFEGLNNIKVYNGEAVYSKMKLNFE